MTHPTALHSYSAPKGPGSRLGDPDRAQAFHRALRDTAPLRDRIGPHTLALFPYTADFGADGGPLAGEGTFPLSGSASRG